MKKVSLFVLMLTIMLVLTGCNSETKLIDKYVDNHKDTLRDFEYYESVKSQNFIIDGNTTALSEYFYTETRSNKTCVATDENDPSGFNEFTVTCKAYFYETRKGTEGIEGFPNQNDDYAVHPVYKDYLLEEELLTFFTDADQIETDDENIVMFRKTIKFNEFSPNLRNEISRNFNVSYPEIPVIVTLEYNVEKEMFTSYVIDNSDVMILAYSENFGTEIQLTNWYITVTHEEYTDNLKFFFPDEQIDDDFINYFEDGDLFGYYSWVPGTELNGLIEYKGDWDVVELVIPEGGLYNITYASDEYEASIIFILFDDSSGQFEQLYEGVVGEPGKELSEIYLYSGVYYISIFSHNNASGYDLYFDRVQ